MHKFFTKNDFKERRNLLIKLIREKFQNFEGSIFLFANLEISTTKFKQDSSFYYFTGINEPGAVLQIDLDGKSILYVPNCGPTRVHWVSGCVNPNNCDPVEMGFDELKFLGEETKTYEFQPFFNKNEYINLISEIDAILNKNNKIFTLNPNDQSQYFNQRFILNRINSFLNIEKSIFDISSLVAELRRKKSKNEIEVLYKAVDITVMGHESVIQTLSLSKLEYEIQAGIEYVFTCSGADLAFPSIVGSGKNSTILHYTANNKQINSDELVLIDIGAQFEHYCGDLTRVYPSSGKFNKRQKEVYNLVLETQQYIENLAVPGMWLSNKHKPLESLNHIAREFLKEKGYDKYFLHGIGHFLGLDVHDVGDYSEPLKPGDVITIEPGIYIPEENIGVRIEDNYWVVEDGIVCLSEQLPKTVEEIEKLFVS